ncbi:aminotransferase-like domain-containing protein [Sphaerisporangium fuscum]|uniref:aminotransferase-like domain-containing protein n=1 Tax=Sphaerisporangium fuscum TaxID=2835868 RepID=UPI001BDDA928|nr:PLP-dependent aminotransferase family protein [Sphaerisporangium fuscum]
MTVQPPGARSFVVSLGDWRGGRRPLARELARAVREAVLDGRLPVGTALPSERALAQALALSRGTVVAGLAALRDGGWIHTRHGSGSVVRLPRDLTERTAPWSQDHGGARPEIDLTLAVTAAPHEAYLAAARRAVGRLATLLVDDGTSSAGLPRLREVVAGRYTRDGLPTRPEQILITSGAQAALELLTDHLRDGRAPVLVEHPTYPGALDLLRRRRARLVSVPVTADGWDLALLGDAVRAHRPRLAYLVPDFHNPTGAHMPPAERSEVAALAARHGLTVIVDETMRDLDLRTPPRPVPFLSGPGVVSVGSTSKVIWAGLGVGWIRTTAARVRELLLNPLQGRFSPPPLEQLIACELLGDDQGFAGLLDDRRARLREQRDHLAGLLAAHPEWSFTVPPGGLSLWLRLPEPVRPVPGLALATGPRFSADRALHHYLRLPFTATPEALTRVVALLASAAPGRRSR